VGEFNSAMFRITSELKLCGEKIIDEDMLEKTFFTFHALNLLLQQQYRERGFKKYSELKSCLLVAEQNNEFRMKNHQSQPTSSSSFPEANATTFPEMNATSFKGNRGQDVVTAPEEVVDMIVIMFGDVKVIISNQMTTMWGDMKRKRIHHLLKSLKIVVIDVV
jgi:hypothetical protein